MIDTSAFRARVRAGQPTLLKEQKAGWRVQWRNDGYDYPALLNKFRSGELKGTVLTTGSRFREVWRLETGGRKFVVKRDWEVDRRLEKKLWDWLGGTTYHRLIKFTARAVLKGCRVAQDVYLVAERMSWGRCLEAWLVAEYVEGQSFIKNFENGLPAEVLEGFDRYAPQMNEALERLHDCGLASNDIHPGQFILTEEGLRIIDLSPNGPMIVCQVNDALTMMHFFGVRPPLLNPWRRLLFELLTLRRRFKNYYRGRRKQGGPG